MVEPVFLPVYTMTRNGVEVVEIGQRGASKRKEIEHRLPGPFSPTNLRLLDIIRVDYSTPPERLPFVLPRLYVGMADTVRDQSRVREGTPALRIDDRQGRELACITLSGYRVVPVSEASPAMWARRLAEAHNSHNHLVELLEEAVVESQRSFLSVQHASTAVAINGWEERAKAAIARARGHMP